MHRGCCLQLRQKLVVENHIAEHCGYVEKDACNANQGYPYHRLLHPLRGDGVEGDTAGPANGRPAPGIHLVEDGPNSPSGLIQGLELHLLSAKEQNKYSRGLLGVGSRKEARCQNNTAWVV